MAKKMTVLGSGSWGSALAEVQARAGHPVKLWGRDTDLMKEFTSSRTNSKYHSEHRFSENIIPTFEIKDAVGSAEFVFFAIPSHALRETLEQYASLISSNALLICAAKGIEAETLKTPSAIFEDVLGFKECQKRYAILSGPSFAKEVVAGTPTALTVAAFNDSVGLEIQKNCHTDKFRVFTSDDVIGVELAAALKNVIAIAAGASDGLGFGLNARAALITRALAEISKIGIKKGAHPLTFSGLSGLGDLLLTCTGDLSRNRQVGLKLAQGKSIKTILKEIGQVAEGLRTAKAAYTMATDLKVEAFILEEIYRALYEKKPLRQAVADLLARAPGEERA